MCYHKTKVSCTKNTVIQKRRVEKNTQHRALEKLGKCSTRAM
jgi:hypothetical protein